MSIYSTPPPLQTCLNQSMTSQGPPKFLQLRICHPVYFSHFRLPTSMLSQEENLTLSASFSLSFSKALSKSTCEILSNFKYIGISNDTRSAPYTLVTSDLRRPSWHEKKSLFENRRHDTVVGLPTKFHSILEFLVTFFLIDVMLWRAPIV